MAGSPQPGLPPQPEMYPPADAPGCLPARPGCLLWSAGAFAAVVLGAILLYLMVLRPGGDDPEPGRVVAGGTPTATAPAASPPPAEPDRWAVELADPAGGLSLAGEGGAEVAYRQEVLAGIGVEVIELVGGQYEGSADAPSVSFHGGTLVEPRDAAELAEPAGELLAEAFAVNFPNQTPTGDAREHDAGPLGGQLWCVSYQDGSFACGWLDEQTIGYVFVFGGSEAGAAELLVKMRADLEVR